MKVQRRLRRRWKNGFTQVAAVLFVLVAGCSPSPEQVISGASDADRAEFASASETWATHSGAYTMTYTSPCGESASFTDVDTTVEVAEDGTATIIEGPDTTPLTIELILDQIEGALAEAEIVDVTYSELGYPITVNVDWAVNSIDDEFCPRISNLK